MEGSVDKQKPRNIITYWEAMSFVGELLIIVAVPTTLLAFLGRRVDTLFGTSPWATIVGLLLAVAFAMTFAWRRGKKMAERLKAKR